MIGCLGGDFGGGLFGFLFSQPFFAAADVFFDPAVAFEGDGTGRNVVEETTVVADEQEGAGIFEEALFEEFDGFDVEVVRRLVEYEDVSRLDEELGQQEARALATGEFGDGGAGGLRGEEEVL